MTIKKVRSVVAIPFVPGTHRGRELQHRFRKLKNRYITATGSVDVAVIRVYKGLTESRRIPGLKYYQQLYLCQPIPQLNAKGVRAKPPNEIHPYYHFVPQTPGERGTPEYRAARRTTLESARMEGRHRNWQMYNRVERQGYFEKKFDMGALVEFIDKPASGPGPGPALTTSDPRKWGLIVGWDDTQKWEHQIPNGPWLNESYLRVRMHVWGVGGQPHKTLIRSIPSYKVRALLTRSLVELWAIIPSPPKM